MTCSSNDGTEPPFSVVGSVGPRPLTKSGHVNVLAGIWTIRLHGTVIVTLFSATVPPAWSAGVFGHRAGSTFASWMKPVTSKPCSVATGAENGGSGSDA